MITRNDVLSHAVDNCMKELYSFVQPQVEWEKFIEENKIYKKAYFEWEQYKRYEKENPDLFKEYNERLDWKDKSITECIGPRPYEFYYLPKEVMKDITDSYVRAYRMDSQQELLNTIEILKKYCQEPIIDKYIEGKNGFPGHRGYEHPDNLEQEIVKILGDVAEDNAYYQHKLLDKFFEFLDMAGKFYDWNRDLNSFNMSVYLGPSPNSNKDAVIRNWKQYRNKDIEIDEEQIKKEYYGEDYND